MNDQRPLALSKWPFYVGDLVLLLAAGVIYWQGGHAPWQGRAPLLPWEAWALVACVALGAVLAACPYVLEFLRASRLVEAQRLDHAVLQVQNIEIIAKRISGATANWQAVQDDSTKAVQAAREIAESMAAEARTFRDFLQKANETEKHHLRLEVEKLHRSEAEWLQALTRILDHTYALHQAAVRSGRPDLIEQLGHFQRACRETARRLGLVPFEARPGDPYDPKVHQLTDANAVVPPDPVVADTLATGMRFQGQIARLPLVTLKGAHQERSDLSLRDINDRREQAGARAPVAKVDPPATGANPPVEQASPAGTGQEPAPAAPAEAAQAAEAEAALTDSESDAEHGEPSRGSP